MVSSIELLLRSFLAVVFKWASTYFLVPAATTTVTGLICVGSGQSRPTRHLFAPGGERSLSASNCPHPYNAGGK